MEEEQRNDQTTFSHLTLRQINKQTKQQKGSLTSENPPNITPPPTCWEPSHHSNELCHHSNED